jgi:hypothetical protein
MKIFALKVLRPGADRPDLFLVCAPSHAEAAALLDARLNDQTRQTVGSAELREGIAEFIAMKPGEVMAWAPLVS